MSYTDSDFTAIPEADVIQCINCGAYAATRAAIRHYPTCKPGEGKRWEEYYEKENAEIEAIEKELIASGYNEEEED